MRLTPLRLVCLTSGMGSNDSFRLLNGEDALGWLFVLLLIAVCFQ